MKRQPQLPQVVLAVREAGLFPNTLNGWRQQREQRSANEGDHKEFHMRQFAQSSILKHRAPSSAG